MANTFLLCSCLLLLGVGRSAAAPDAKEHSSCQVWDNIAKQLTTRTGAQQACSSNGTEPCTRIDCSGAYQYNGKNTFGVNFGARIEVDYCFGVILNHCDRNISLDFYMQVPLKHVNTSTRVYHNTLLSIPGLSFQINSGTSAQGYLYFEMQRLNNEVTFSVTVKVRLVMAGFSTWPTTLQRQLIQNETVPVPPCPGGVHNATSPRPALGVCHPPSWKPLPPSVTVHPPTKGGVGQPCNQSVSCRDKWLMCDLTSRRCVCKPEYKPGGDYCQPLVRHGLPCSKDGDCSLIMSERCYRGLCSCQDGSVFREDLQTCEPQSGGKVPVDPKTSTERPRVQPAAHTSKEKKDKTGVIVAAVIGSLVVLAGILLAAFFAIRRLRRPYHNRELLLEGEDSDGVM